MDREMGWAGLGALRMHSALGLRYHFRAFEEAPFSMFFSVSLCYVELESQPSRDDSCFSNPPPWSIPPGPYDCMVNTISTTMKERQRIQWPFPM